jgi:hypothetical protein
MGVSRSNAQNMVNSIWPEVEPFMENLGETIRQRQLKNPVSSAQLGEERRSLKPLSELQKGIYGTVTKN